MNADYYAEGHPQRNPQAHEARRSPQPHKKPDGPDIGPEDFITDAEFERRFGGASRSPAVTEGRLAQMSSAVIGPEDFGGYEGRRTGGESGFYPVPPHDATIQHNNRDPPQSAQNFIPDPHPYRPSGVEYMPPSGPPPNYVPSGNPGPIGQQNAYPHQPQNEEYLPPSGPPPNFRPAESLGSSGQQNAHPPKGGYMPPTGPPPTGSIVSGSNNPYKLQSQSHHGHSLQTHQFAHIPRMASIHDEHTDPALFEQAAYQLRQSNAPSQSNNTPHGESDYNTHIAAHAQAFGPDSQQSSKPMGSDDIGSAAAVQAFKMAAAQSQQTSPPAGRAQAGPPSASKVNHATPTEPTATGDTSEGSEDEAPTSGNSPQDKIIALAMAQAAKIFDKKNGGSPSDPAASQAKLQAMHSAASTVMRLAADYKKSGKLSLQPGEMQSLISAAMSIL